MRFLKINLNSCTGILDRFLKCEGMSYTVYAFARKPTVVAGRCMWSINLSHFTCTSDWLVNFHL